MLRIYHGDPPAPEIVDKVTLGPEGNPGLITRAELCQVGTGQLVFDDPTGVLDIQAQKRLYVNEDLEAAGDIRSWFGYVGDRSIGREVAGLIYTNALGRGWPTDLDDVNAALGFRIFPRSGTGAAGGDRPAESVGDRMTWLMGTSQMSAFHDLGFIDYPAAPIMDPADYRGQFVRDVILDCANEMGAANGTWNAFGYYWEATGELGLWFNDPGRLDLWPSPLAISNIDAEIDLATTFPPGYELQYQLSAARVFSGIDFNYKNGSVYRQRAATITEFYNRDTSVSEPNVTTLAKATFRADALLEIMASEDEKLTNVVVELPSEQINDIQAGMWLNVHLSHLVDRPGWDQARPCRVLARTLRDPENRSQAVRKLELELTPVESAVHQVILSTRGNVGVDEYVALDETPRQMIFGGAFGGGLAFATPTIVQDTDGYAVRIEDPEVATDTGDPFGDPCYVKEIVIPETLADGTPGAGLYRYVWEGLNQVGIGNPHYYGSIVNIYNSASILGYQRRYEIQAQPTGMGAALVSGTFTVSVRVNGDVRGSVSGTAAGYTNGSTFNGGVVRLAAGDSVTLFGSVTGTYYEALYNSLGMSVYGAQQGGFVLTRVGP